MNLGLRANTGTRVESGNLTRRQGRHPADVGLSDRGRRQLRKSRKHEEAQCVKADNQRGAGQIGHFGIMTRRTQPPIEPPTGPRHQPVEHCNAHNIANEQGKPERQASFVDQQRVLEKYAQQEGDR